MSAGARITKHYGGSFCQQLNACLVKIFQRFRHHICLMIFMDLLVPLLFLGFGLYLVAESDIKNPMADDLDKVFVASPACIAIGLGFSAISLITVLTAEKQLGMKNNLRMIGLRDFVYWLSYFCVYYPVIFLLTITVACIISFVCLQSTSSFIGVAVLCVEYGLSIFFLGCLMSTLFDTTMIAMAVGAVFIVLFPLITITLPKSFTMMVLFSPLIFVNGMRTIEWFVSHDEDVDLIEEAGNFGFTSRLIVSILILFVDCVLYAFLTYWCDHVIPHKFGREQQVFFCFSDCGGSSGPSNFSYDESKFQGRDIEKVSKEMKSREAGIFENLTKMYTGGCCGLQTTRNKALMGLNLRVYQGEITALLGHNGAGKTTLFNLLSGNISMGMGRAYIYGYDIRSDKQLAKLRTMTGMCPQHDILYKELTVQQHLRLFGAIRGLSKTNIDRECDEMLGDLVLKEKLRARVGRLSGGQKRKLSVALALLGDPPLVYLDEPTTGVDPVSRRKMWNLLVRKKPGKLILLSTHFMDEADILADRKAILSQGVLRCFGTSLFLKNKFGLGYYLTMVLKEKHDVVAVRELVKRNIHKAEENQFHGREITFILPKSETRAYPALLEKIEKDVSVHGPLGIESYSVTMTTLQDVFLQLAQPEKAKDRDIDKAVQFKAVKPKKSQCEIFCAIVKLRIKRKLNNCCFWCIVLVVPINYLVLPGIMLRLQGENSSANSTKSDNEMIVRTMMNYMWPSNVNTALSLIPVMLTLDLIEDRVIQAQNLLRVNGVSFNMYFITIFTLYFCITFFVIAVALITQVTLLSFSAFGEPFPAVLCFLGLVLYIVPSLLFHSTISFMFKNVSQGQILYPLAVIVSFAVASIGMNIGSSIEDADVKSGFNTGYNVGWSFLAIVYVPFSVLHGLLIAADENCPKDASECGIGDFFATLDYSLILAAIVFHWVLWSILLKIAWITNGGRNCNALGQRNKVSKHDCRVVPPNPGEDIDVHRERERIRKYYVKPSPPYESVAVHGLRKSFGRKKVVQNVSFGVSKGEIFGLLGSNGAGKSTTMRMMIAQEAPSKGCVMIDQYKVMSKTSPGLRQMGYCPQFDALWKGITVKHHLELYATIKGIPKAQRRGLVNDYMDGLGIKEFANRRAGKCSGGTQRKVSYAIAMMGDPKLVLLDEPTSGMDPQTKRFVWDSVQANIKGSKGAVLTTHHMEEADALCSIVGILIDGQLKCIGSPQHLKDTFGHGYHLELKLPLEATPADWAALMRSLKQHYPSIVVEEMFGNQRNYMVPKQEIQSLAQAFRILDQLKMEHGIEEYGLGQTTLEQVFLMFADPEKKPQRHAAQPIRREFGQQRRRRGRGRGRGNAGRKGRKRKSVFSILKKKKGQGKKKRAGKEGKRRKIKKARKGRKKKRGLFKTKRKNNA